MPTVTRLADRTVSALQESIVAKHDVDMPSIRPQVEYAPLTHDIVGWTVSVKCTCGAEVSASALDLARATDQVTDLICEHIHHENGETGDCPPSLTVSLPPD